MAKTDKAKSALPYARRLLEDEYVQEQLLSAAAALRTAYGRARKQRAGAAEDKKLYGHVREAATSVRRAMSALQRPTPAPKKRRLRKAAILAFSVGGSVWLTAKLGKRQAAPAQADEPAAPVTRVPDGDEASARPEQAATPAS
jgi:hypothetical protein